MQDEKIIRKIAVFGGSFDPPHYGHYDIVKNLEKIFDLVIVVPSNISPFKDGADDAKLRLKLCKRMFTSQKTQVLAREITRGGISYSVETARFLYKKYRKIGASLTWVIGSEELERLDEWHEIDELKKLVGFLVVSRPGFAPDKDKLDALKKRGIKIRFSKFSGLDISSTVIKIDAAFDKTNKYMPTFVYEAARKYGLFNPYDKYVSALFKYGVTDKRLAHTYGVAVRGAELAKMYGANVHDAVIACILHDIAKYVNTDEYAGKVDCTGFPPQTIHAPIGAYIAKREFGVSPEIEHAIFVHATGDANMSLLDEIVYLADKTEAGRSYSEVYLFRYLCDIDRTLAMYATLSEVSEFKGNLPCEYASRALEYYADLCKDKVIPDLPKNTVNTHSESSRPNTELGEVQSKSILPVPDKSVRVVKENNKSIVAVKTADGEKSQTDDKNPVPFTIADAVAKELLLHKAHDVDVIDLAGKTIIADYFILASATSTTAVKALYGYIEDLMTKRFGLDPTKRDLDKEWVALDYGCVIVHIFTDRTREFYNIERLWTDGKNITRYGD